MLWSSLPLHATAVPSREAPGLPSGGISLMQARAMTACHSQLNIGSTVPRRPGPRLRSSSIPSAGRSCSTSPRLTSGWRDVARATAPLRLIRTSLLVGDLSSIVAVNRAPALAPDAVDGPVHRHRVRRAAWPRVWSLRRGRGSSDGSPIHAGVAPGLGVRILEGTGELVWRATFGSEKVETRWCQIVSPPAQTLEPVGVLDGG